MAQVRPAFADPNVAAVFRAYPPKLRTKLMALRRLIFATAAATDGVGTLHETLKWGQPSYLTPSRSGTTVRIDRVKGADDRYALFVPCQTILVETFRARYADELIFESNRAVLFDVDAGLPTDCLRHCIALALTYHRRKTR